MEGKHTSTRHRRRDPRSICPSLDRLPRVLWNTPLGTYTELTLAQIRQLKTHGEKRVAAVLEVFAELHAVLSRLGSPGNLAVRIVPKFASQLEHWTLVASQHQPSPHPRNSKRIWSAHCWTNSGSTPANQLPSSPRRDWGSMEHPPAYASRPDNSV